ncbi:hypothetical protein FOIG_14508 [Fusarium odoratissimum NRRL 54006]|uniref:Uncharacterized protein n=1 Tax=Fusarium odoratissimum (strain NRRL 54006) TaxID=1089451 RepID=X0J865_FUSO5|nr:uncharacterized protein FOIG_14508 [Fusarium odoratissimum NRRL 54006]EXL92561.1 hypothetical protein FOIG_14508 [Fusarium odoratissimum NRRL 54006]
MFGSISWLMGFNLLKPLLIATYNVGDRYKRQPCW